MKYNKDENDLFDFAKELMNYPKNFNFAFEINNWLRSGDRKEDKLFSYKQYKELARLLTERAVAESKDNSIFDSLPDYVGYIVQTWYERNKSGFDKYVNEYLDKKKTNVLVLLRAYAPVIRSSEKVEPYKGDLKLNSYKYLVTFFNKDDLYRRILELYTTKEIQEEEPFWIERFDGKLYTDLNMVRQFAWWYFKEKEGEK